MRRGRGSPLVYLSVPCSGSACREGRGREKGGWSIGLVSEPSLSHFLSEEGSAFLELFSLCSWSNLKEEREEKKKKGKEKRTGGSAEVFIPLSLSD